MRTLIMALLLAIGTCVSVSAKEVTVRSKSIIIRTFESEQRATNRLKNVETELAAVANKLKQKVPEQPITVCYATNDGQFEQFAKEFGLQVEDWVAGITYAHGTLIIIKDFPTVTPTHSPQITLRHELAHWIIAAINKKRGQEIPRWLNEGLAMWAADQTLSRLEYLKIASLSKREQLKRFEQLRHGMSSNHHEVTTEYQQCVAFVQWLEEKLKERGKGIPDFVRELEAPVSLDVAFFRALPIDEIEADWRYELSQESSELEFILRSLGLYHWLTLLAVLAFIRYLFKRRKQMAELERQDREEAPRMTMCGHCGELIPVYLYEEHAEQCELSGFES